MAKVGKDLMEASERLFELVGAQKRLFHATAKEHGLSPQQAATIVHLEPGVGMPMSALADLLMCDASNVTGIIDKLEARGFTRRGQAEDRRVKVLTLTESGEALRTTLRERMMAPPPWLTKMSREDQKIFKEILGRACEALRSTEES
jgi:DNA-binding MarR family transcriptional regulator